MDPQLANLNLDPPRQPSPIRRGLVPALLVNAVFFAGVALSLHWRAADPGEDVATRADAGSETRTMGAAPALAPPPASPKERAAEVPQPQPQAQSQSPQPQLQAPNPPQAQPQPQPQLQRQPVTQAVPPTAPPTGTTTQGRPEPRVVPARAESRPKRQAAENDESVTRQATGVAVQPSFACAKARSRSERIICSDPELAQLDRDTGRLHARAKAAARDPAAFKRQNDREWKQREADCRDKACLLAWYAHRREQLQQTVAQAR